MSESLNLVSLKNQIECLDKIHHIKILNILKNNSIKYSENRNGIFVNMNSFDNNTIDQINKILLYIKNQEKNLIDIENIKIDTYQHKKLFFSHRRSSHNNDLPTGRMINIIGFSK